MENLRKCCKCGEEKPLDEYYKSSRNGHQHQCKQCYKLSYENSKPKEGFYSSEQTRKAYGWHTRQGWGITEKKIMQEVNLRRLIKGY